MEEASLSCPRSRSRSLTRPAAGLAVLALTLLDSHPVFAYCRTTTCRGCARDPITGCTIEGTPVAWPTACVSFSMQEDASQQIDLEAATALMSEAFAIWEASICDRRGAHPSIHVSAGEPAQCAGPQYNGSAPNANVIAFRDQAWTYTGTDAELGATTVTISKTGEIYDADMEINASEPLITEPSDPDAGTKIISGAHDLLSLLTHEAGHFLGLDHSREEGSVMQLDLPSNFTRTTLSADDVDAICAAYPPYREAGQCDPTPRGGFASECQSAAGGCSFVPAPRHGGLHLFGLILLLMAARRALPARRVR